MAHAWTIQELYFLQVKFETYENFVRRTRFIDQTQVYKMTNFY